MIKHDVLGGTVATRLDFRIIVMRGGVPFSFGAVSVTAASASSTPGGGPKGGTMRRGAFGGGGGPPPGRP